MSVFSEFLARLNRVLDDLAHAGDIPADAARDRLTMELPRDRSHGDLATNAALVLAKEAKTNPRALAEKIAAGFAADPDVLSADVAGPGFINLTLAPAYWTGALARLVTQGGDSLKPHLSDGQKVNVEYVSANPTGPMHIGHCRGAVYGDALASVLAFAGYDVTREYYINDAGGQVDVLARSTYLRYLEALGEDVGPIPEGLYPGDYLVPVGEKLAADHGRSLLELDESAWLPIVRQTAVEMMMALIREDLAALNVHHDVFFSETTLHAGNASRISGAIAALESQGYVYKGTLPPPKGQLPEDWEDREQILFRSTEVGDDIDRPLVKSDGAYTYFAADVAYFQDKFLRGFEETIYILGADHGGYVKRLEALARAISGGSVKLTVKLCQLVKLFRAGEPVRMSKRSGDFVTLREVGEKPPD